MPVESKATTQSASQPTRVYAFGTSGYRSDQDEGFNAAVVIQITHAIGDYLIEEINRTGQLYPVLIGGDTRTKTKQFIPVISQLLLDKGFDVYQAESDAPTPVLAYAAKYFAECGFTEKKTLGCILMTASHNPWAYGGYNFLTPDAAVVPSTVSKAFEENQRNPKRLVLDRAKFGLSNPATLHSFDPYPIYRDHLKKQLKIGYETLRASGLRIFYDPLYATGRHYLPRLLKEENIAVQTIHDQEERPSNYSGMPEPSAENLTELSKLVAEESALLKLGLANDGDADRFGVLDEQGRFVPPSDVLALVLYHVLTHRKQTGVVVRSQATTHLLDALAQNAGLETVQTPVGYKYIAEEFIDREQKGKTPVVFGGESSGGLSIGGHIPEKDGLLADLLVAELVATEKRPLSAILESVKGSVPEKFAFKEFAIKTDQGKAIMEGFNRMKEQGGLLAGVPVDVAKTQDAAQALHVHFHTQDGLKLYLTDGSWMLIRISGTEPLTRLYVETIATTTDEAERKAGAIVDEITGQLIACYHVPAAAIHAKH